MAGPPPGEAHYFLIPEEETFQCAGDLRLTEGSAIMKYLADKYDLPAYPKDLKKRAKINEMMDWLNTQFYRDFGYGLVYPQLFPHHKRRSEEAHSGTIAWGQQGAKTWLQILNDYWIGPKANISVVTNSQSPIISVQQSCRSVN